MRLDLLLKRGSCLLVLVLSLLSAPQRGDAQGVLAPPPFERARAGLFTLQMENSLAADNDNVYQGSWAFRVRRDWQALGLAAALGSAFGAERALLASLTGHYSFPAVGEGLQRLVSGVLVDATQVAMDEGGNVTNLSAGVALGGEFDSVIAGVGIHVMAGARVGQLLHEEPAADESYFGAALATSFGIMRRFALFAQLDYASASPRAGEAAFTFGTGLRMRIGPGR